MNEYFKQDGLTKVLEKERRRKQKQKERSRCLENISKETKPGTSFSYSEKRRGTDEHVIADTADGYHSDLDRTTTSDNEITQDGGQKHQYNIV